MKRRNYWILTDTHFGHDKLVKSGYRKEGFEDKILDNVEAVVREGDILIHLGDVAFYDTKRWHTNFCSLVHLLGAKAWLVKGNHDKDTMGWYLDRGWDFVGEELAVDLYGCKCLFTHVPVKMRHRFDLNVHGHLHNLEWRQDVTRFFNHLVQIEDTLAPFKLQDIVERYKNERL